MDTLIPGREFVLNAPAQKVIDEAIQAHPRLDDVLMGLEWRVLHDPGAGYRIPNTTPATYIVRSKQWVKVPSLVLLYQFDANTVTVLSARVLPFSTDDE